MGIEWREALESDVGRVGRFRDRKGDDWTYGLLETVDAQECVYSCVSMENDPAELFIFCEVQQMTVPEPVHVVCVTDEETGHEAVYVGGDLMEQDATMYGCDIARLAQGMAIQLSHVSLRLPEQQEYPRRFEDCMKFVTTGLED